MTDHPESADSSLIHARGLTKRYGSNLMLSTNPVAGGR